MARGICRVGDSVIGTCNAPVSGHPRPFTGVWTEGSSVVTADNIGIVRIGDHGITDCGHHFVAIVGSSIANADGIGVVRVNDPVLVVEGGTGVTVGGSGIVTTD